LLLNLIKMKKELSVTEKAKNYGFVAVVVFLFGVWIAAGLFNIKASEKQYSVLAWQEIHAELEAKILWEQAKELGITIIEDENGDYGLAS